MKNSNAGFTVIELVVTLAIAAIVLTMAAASMTTLNRGSRVTAAVDQFHNSMVFAQQTAGYQKTNITLQANAGGWQNGWQVLDADNQMLRTYPAFTGGVTFSSAGNVTSYTFNAAGFLTTGALDTVTVCQAKYEKGRQISISPLGRISRAEVTCTPTP